MKAFVTYLVLLIIVVLLGLLLAFPTKWLINGLFSQAFLLFLFGTTKISVWTAWGINILCGLLFKSTETSSK